MARKQNAVLTAATKNKLAEYNTFSDFLFPLPDPPDPDFSDECITIIIPAGRRLHEVSTFFNISDDDIDEDEESFAIVAEILDVPDNTSCFQIGEGETKCFGTRGATEVRITDNDRELFTFLTITF